MARKAANLILEGGAKKALERGQLEIQKGVKAMGIRLTIVLTIVAGASLAAPVLATSDALVSAVLSKLRLRRFDYGKQGKFVPYLNFLLSELEGHMRRSYFLAPSAVITGDTDIAAGEEKTLTVNFILPTGKWAAFKGRDANRWGAGRSQVSTMRFDLERPGSNELLVGAAAATGVSIKASTNISIDFDPDVTDAKGDPWSPIPHVHTFDESKDVVRFPEQGLPLVIEETNATVFNNFTLKVDDQVIHEQVSTADVLREDLARAAEVSYFRELALQGDSFNTGLVLFDQSMRGREFRDYLTGAPAFRQNTRDQQTVYFRYTYLPLTKAEDVAGVVSHVATHIRSKELKAVSEASLRGENVPPRLQPFVGMRLLDTADAEWEQAAGLYAKPNGTDAQPEAPATLTEVVRKQAEALRAKGDTKAAEQLTDRFVASVPGTVQSSRGFASGDRSMRDDRRAKLGIM